MIPNELREFDFSIRHNGGIIEIKGYQKGNWGTLLKLTSLKLISLPDFHKANDSCSFIIRNRKKEVDDRFSLKMLSISPNFAHLQSCKIHHRTSYTLFLCRLYHGSRICKNSGCD